MIQEAHADGFGLFFDEQDLLVDLQTDFQHLQIFATSGVGKVMLLDGLVMLTEKDEMYYHESIVHPVATHITALQSALVIGGGDGGTAREILKYGAQVDLIEIDNEVVQASIQHLPTIASSFSHPNMNLNIGDGCAFVAQSPAGIYDLICVDSSEPIGPNGTLFTEEFYRHVQRCLAPTGYVVVQAGSPMWQQSEIDKVHEKLKKIFGHVQPYTGFTPSYPGGHWTFFACGDYALPTEAVRPLPATQWLHSNAVRGMFLLGELG